MNAPFVIGPTNVYLFAKSTLDAVAASLSSAPNGSPNRSIVTFGEIAWDESTCGQLALTVVQSYPSQGFPNQTQIRHNCDSALIIYSFGLELSRCAPGVDENASAPSEDEMNAFAAGMLYDAYVMRTTLACVLADLMKSPQMIADWQINEDTAVGPLGDSAANRLNFLVAWFQDCGCGD